MIRRWSNQIMMQRIEERKRDRESDNKGEREGERGKEGEIDRETERERERERQSKIGIDIYRDRQREILMRLILITTCTSIHNLHSIRCYKD